MSAPRELHTSRAHIHDLPPHVFHVVHGFMNAQDAGRMYTGLSTQSISNMLRDPLTRNAVLVRFMQDHHGDPPWGVFMEGDWWNNRNALWFSETYPETKTVIEDYFFSHQENIALTEPIVSEEWFRHICELLTQNAMLGFLSFEEGAVLTTRLVDILAEYLPRMQRLELLSLSGPDADFDFPTNLDKLILEPPEIDPDDPTLYDNEQFSDLALVRYGINQGGTTTQQLVAALRKNVSLNSVNVFDNTFVAEDYMMIRAALGPPGLEVGTVDPFRVQPVTVPQYNKTLMFFWPEVAGELQEYLLARRIRNDADD